MTSASTNALLNDLLVELHRSRIQYIADAWPWSTRQTQALKTTVLQVAERQRQAAQQFANLLMARKHSLDFGIYPHEYTSLNYVAIEFAFTQLVSSQQGLVEFFESSLPELKGDAPAEEIVRKALDAAKEDVKTLMAATPPAGSQAAGWMK